MISFATILLAAATAVAQPVEPTAAELLQRCREMLPESVELSGRLIVRNRRGIVRSEHSYVYKRSAGAETTLSIDGKKVVHAADTLKPLVEGSAVTWSDILLDYLAWDDVSYDPSPEKESVHGQKCRVLVLKKGNRLMRVWLDRKTSALLQAEENVAGEKPSVRRLWGTRLKKFDGRWAPSVMEVEIVGSGLRTKVTVEEMK